MAARRAATPRKRTFTDAQRARALEEKLLNEAGVACLAGTAFGAMGEGYLRFSYAASSDDIREALRRVRECLQPA